MARMISEAIKKERTQKDKANEKHWRVPLHP